MEYYVSMVLKVDPEAPFLSVYGSHQEEILDRVLNAIHDIDDVEVVTASIQEDD